MPYNIDNTAHLLSHARSTVNRFLVDALRAHELGALSPSHGDLIASLLHNGPMTMTALARRINRDPSTVTTLVHKLVGEGYVTYEDNPDDARSRLVALTPQGQALKEIFTRVSVELAATMWHGIDDPARDAFRETLQQIIENFESRPELDL